MDKLTRIIESVLLFQIKRRITSLYKGFLFTIEDIQDEFPDTISYERGQILRKQILDAGNEAYREIEEMFYTLKDAQEDTTEKEYYGKG